MANVANISGFVLDKNINGGFMPSSITCATASGDSVAIAKGDIVKLVGGSDVRGRPIVAQIAAGSATVGQTPFGVVTGVQPLLNTLYNNYRLASTTTQLKVCVDPNALYSCNVAGAGLTTSSVGETANVVVGSISTVFGKSAMQLDSADTSGSSATLPLRIMGILDNPLNVDLASGAVTNSRAIVKLNGTAITGLGTAGV